MRFLSTELTGLAPAGRCVGVCLDVTPIPTLDEDNFHELLSYFRALGEVVIFHKPNNPRGANFQQCLDAAQQAGYDDVVDELQQMQDSHQYWVEYALEQLNTVQQVATRFDGLQVHSWHDDELVRSTSGQLQSKLKAMQQAVSPESFSERDTDASPEQSELARDSDSIQHLI